MCSRKWNKLDSYIDAGLTKPELCLSCGGGTNCTETVKNKSCQVNGGTHILCVTASELWWVKKKYLLLFVCFTDHTLTKF